MHVCRLVKLARLEHKSELIIEDIGVLLPVIWNLLI